MSSLSPKIVAAGLTDPGKIRVTNEDAIFVDKGLSLFVVADGMGGMSSGEIASGFVIEMVRRELARGTLAQSPAAFLNEALARANSRVYFHSLDNPEKRGMGSTVVALAFAGGRFFHAHAGDSRLYRLRGFELRQLTHDHSLVWALYREGKISKQQMMTDRRANQISRAIGIRDELEAEFGEDDLEAGDVFLLCSDGLHGMVDDPELAQVLSRKDPP
ncbi:MAG: serine/threonine-protein phosphatase, partial [Candidatus Riflebacteria bacterium]|nr:serine/threonine-protein phosphatase [Candidatus Riflebacteria bacterium]